MAEMIMPKARGKETFGDFQITREERIDKIKTNSVNTEKINQPV